MAAVASTNPLDPNSYGTTIVYAQGMTGAMTLAFGWQCVADDLVGRLTCGFLWYDPTYGTDVDALTNSSTSVTAAVKAIEQECLKDSRVQQAAATASFVGETLTVNVAITLSGGEQFALVGTPAAELPPGTLAFQVTLSNVPTTQFVSQQ